ncbi:MAG: hypothetical protein ACKO0N_13110 [Planctomycetota bacterium]
MLKKFFRLFGNSDETVKALTKRMGTEAANVYEKLEDRTVLSTFLVQNLADNGSGSLRAAIEQANINPGPDVVRVRVGLQGTVALTSGQLEITDALRLVGPGENRLTISGNSLSRVFKVNTHAGEVFLRGFTVADGLSTQQENVGIKVVRGGGILNLMSQLRVQDLTFRNNRAVDQGNESLADVVGGGAIVNTENAVLRLSQCTFVGNSAAGGTRYSFGGAIASVTNSKAFIQNAVFTSNQVSGGTTNYGGAVATFGGSAASVTKSEFSSNKAIGEGSQKAFGGALAARPGTVDNSASELVALDCRLSENSAAASAASTAGGGAIYSHGSLFVVQGSKLLANWAAAGDVAGGGIQNAQSVGIVMESQLKWNQSIGLSEDGGLGRSFGGGIASTSGGMLTVSKSEVALNEARGINAYGGGIFNGAVYADEAVALLFVDRTSLTQNRAATTRGSSNATAHGGGIFNGNPGEEKTPAATAMVKRTKIERNLAIATAGGKGIGGGVYTVGEFVVDRPLQRQLLDGLAANFATTSDDNVFGQLTLA